MRIFLIISVVILLILSSYAYVLYRFRSSIDFHVAAGSATPSDFNLPAHKLSFKSKDGVGLTSWYIPAQNAKAVVILIHGYGRNGGGKSSMLSHAKYLHAAGYSTLLLDLRSFAESQGDKIWLGTKEWQDVEATYDLLKSFPENQGKKIGFLGVSMGGVTAINTAGKIKKGDFVIASAPYKSIFSAVKTQAVRETKLNSVFIPFLQLATLQELGREADQITPEKLISHIRVPIFLIRAEHDSEVDVNDAQALFEMAGEPKTFWSVPTGHDVYAEKTDEFEKRVVEFLDSL